MDTVDIAVEMRDLSDCACPTSLVNPATLVILGPPTASGAIDSHGEMNTSVGMVENLDKEALDVCARRSTSDPVRTRTKHILWRR